MNPESRCKSCGAAIIWARTTTGKAMPVDRKPCAGNLVLMGCDDELVVMYVDPGTGTHMPHFATCPNASEHRKARGQGSLPGVG